MREDFARYLKALEQTERLPLPRLALYQEQLLESLVRHAYDSVPFYRDRLAHLFNAGGGIDLSRWNDIPVLERTEVVARSNQMRAPQIPEGYGTISELSTSGTTGVSLKLAVNSLVGFGANALLTRAAGWFGLDTARPLAAIRRFANEQEAAYPEGKVNKGWSLADPEAPMYSLGLYTPIPQQLEWLARRKAPYLLTQPSNAAALSYAVTPDQGRALGIELIFGIGETIPEGMRELVAERLGARLVGIYACTEIGAIAIECAAKPHYHAAAENALVEIVRDDGSDVAPGEFGRVLVTGFYNYAMPFIRYAIGDVATAGVGPCPCGRTLPVIAQVEGRARSAFLFRDGTRIWPREWQVKEMHAFVPFREFQMVQLDYERIELRYVPDGSGRQADLPGLNAFARKRMHPSVELTAVPMEALPRGPSGKFEIFMSLVAAGADTTARGLSERN